MTPGKFSSRLASAMVAICCLCNGSAVWSSFFFPLNAADLVTDINSANINDESDTIDLGGMTGSRSR